MQSNSNSSVIFRELEIALTSRDFVSADRMTRQLLCDLARKPLPVTPEIVEQIPKRDLIAIDKLWVDWSDGNFGPQAQTAIWMEIGAPAKIFRYEDMSDAQRRSLAESEYEFGYRLGWAEKPRAMTEKSGRGWLGCSYGADTTTSGALPYEYLMCSYGYGLIGLVMAAVAARFSK